MSDLQITFHKRPALFVLIFAIAIIMFVVFFVNVRAAQPYKSCLQIYEATGQFAIPRGNRLYNPALDRDNNGIACEEKP